MLSITDLRKGTIFLLDGQPTVVLEAQHVKIGRGGAVLQTKIKNLATGATLSRNFKQADRFEEAEIERKKFIFLYSHRGEHCFVDEQNRSERFFVKEEQLGPEKNFLKKNVPVDAEFFQEKLLRIVLPIKIDFAVTDAPPGLRGDTAQGGTKTVIIETGAKIQTPLFIGAGDTIRVNTQTGEYVERVEKGK